MLQSIASEALSYVNPVHDAAGDLSRAVAVQRHLLPSGCRRLATLRYAAVSSAARGLGGDLSYFIARPGGKFGIVLADVSGKGVAAALLMANLQASLRCECR